MWEPEPGWLALPGGTGPSTVGVWRAAYGDQAVVVKRLAAPHPGDPAVLSDPTHPAYWRREADVLSTGIASATAGLRAPDAAVEEDAHGITITREWVEDASSSGLFVAVCLGRFAGAELPRCRFLARDQLRSRLARTERGGGWRTLARTTVADLAEALWTRRETLLARLDALPVVPQHGDPSLTNVPGREGSGSGSGSTGADRAIAIDWATLGLGPLGADLGVFAVAAREELEPLVEAYVMGLPARLADGTPGGTPGGEAARDDVLLGARVAAVYTAMTRAEWALARVATGEGALAGKYRHPAVAPHLRALQRLFPAIEALLEA